MAKHVVVALISGGKDSFHAASCVVGDGHELALLAHLFPPPSGPAELDSHMFQTVGSEVVDAYAACTGIPLLRRRIVGSSRNLSLRYDATPGDEVEDLRALLCSARRAEPRLSAVCCGAIRSDYQRLRLEAVAAPLGLVVLSPLWRRNQASLLSEMSACGLEAVVIKVAALGLDASHLGKTVGELAPLLRRLQRKYGCHCCGEGGEFESLTTDCRLFSRGRLVIDVLRVVPPSSGGGGGACHAVVEQWHVEPRGALLAAPSVTDVSANASFKTPLPPPADEDACGAPPAEFAPRGGGGVTLCACAPCRDATAPATDDAVCAALSLLRSRMHAIGLHWGDALCVHLQLPHMSHFAAANAAYTRHVAHNGWVTPPARACVGSSSGDIRVSATFRAPRGSAPPLRRGGMHVQSVSGWAPACIGPYAQATSLGRAVFVAGQLGLIPSSMTLAHGNTDQADAAAAAAAAVCRAMGVEPGGGGSGARSCGVLLAHLYATSGEAMAAQRDAWRNLVSGQTRVDKKYVEDGAEEDVDGTGRKGDAAAEDAPPSEADASRHAVVCLRVPSLPRGAAVEAHPLLCVAGAEGEVARVAHGATRGAWLPGRVCAAVAAVEPDSCGAGSDGAGIAPAAAAALASLAGVLAAAGLQWEDCAMLRVWLPTGDASAPAPNDEESTQPAWARAAKACGCSASPVVCRVLEVSLGDGPPLLGGVLEAFAWRGEPDDV